MGRTKLLFSMISMLVVTVPLVAQPPPQDSLADVARKLREQHDKAANKAPKVFTNDNLPAPAPWEPVNSQVGQFPSATPPSASGEAAGKPASASPSEEAVGKPAESPEGSQKTREYWQGKFAAARRDLANAKRQQELSEDELNLLQIQQVRELDSSAKADLTAKVQAKQSEVDVNKATTDAAQKALDDLDKEFKDSGAPEDWSQTDAPKAQPGG